MAEALLLLSNRQCPKLLYFKMSQQHQAVIATQILQRE